MHRGKKWKQRLLALLLAAVLALSAGCTGQPQGTQSGENGSSAGQAEKKGSQAFDEFLQALPARLIPADSLDVNFLFYDETQFGIERTVLTLPTISETDAEEAAQFTQALLDELEEFDREALTEAQQLTYDILKDSLLRDQAILPYYDLANNPLGSFLGFQAQLPLLLNEFTIKNKTDVESYFHILSTAEETFLSYAANEERRQAQGVGMCERIMDAVIEQCENFSSRDNQFLIDSMNDKLDAAEFLTQEEKTSMKERNEELVLHSLVPAYRALAEALGKIEVKTEEGGLAALPGGQEYYEALLRQQTGIDDSVEEIRAYLEGKMEEYMRQMVELMLENPQLMEIETSEDVRYSSFQSVEETLDYLRERMQEDFPQVGELTYKVQQVPDSMKDNFSPAAYLSAKIDKQPSEPEVIYINGEYSQSLFPTIAHEGYPGHMYQNAYFSSLELPTVRYLLDVQGYTEGWAEYVEFNSWRYADVEDQAPAQLMALNTAITGCCLCLADIGLHYDGWTRDEFARFLRENLNPSLDDETIDAQYALNLETPGNYLTYFLNGLYLQDLRTETELALGDAFDLTAFHEAVLRTGPTSFAILRQQVENYVQQASGAAASQAA